VSRGRTVRGNKTLLGTLTLVSGRGGLGSHVSRKKVPDYLEEGKGKKKQQLSAEVEVRLESTNGKSMQLKSATI